MSLHLLDNELVPVLDLLVASADNEVFVTAEHFYSGFERLHTIMLPLVPAALVASKRVASLTLNHCLTDGQFMSWQQNAWHHTATVSTRNFDEEAHLLMPHQFFWSCERMMAFVVHFAFISTHLSLSVQWVSRCVARCNVLC